jgi:hypothetical protein
MRLRLKRCIEDLFLHLIDNLNYPRVRYGVTDAPLRTFDFSNVHARDISVIIPRYPLDTKWERIVRFD